MNYQQTINSYCERFERLLDKFFEQYDCNIDSIRNAVEYSIKDGGKRVRPTLVYLGADLCSCSPEKVDSVALGIEMIHSYSLVHDDLPCMDDDSLRRGKPTTHVKFGQAMAVLAGDGLLNLAFETMLADCNDSYSAKAIAYIAQCSGIKGMVGGQALDIVNVDDDITTEQVNYLNSLKTGKLIKAALVGSCIKCGASDELLADVDTYAECIGIIFQLVDDLLDKYSTRQALGKSIGKDAAQNKKTYLVLAGEDNCRQKISEMLDKAIGVISKYGDKASNLIEFAKYLTVRIN
ncbi:MAG: polyprenyl synthetase family protein [Christensenellales bacterium]